MGTFVRIRDLTRFNDGNISARDLLTPTIRVFSPTGKFVRTVGRQGGGPGEFRLIMWDGDQGDTIVAFDGFSQRLTRFRHDGTLINSAPLEGITRGELVIGRLRDGTWIVRTYGPGRVPTTPGVVRDSFTMTALSETSPVSRRPLGSAPSIAMLAEMGNPVPFGTNTFVAAWGDLIWIGDNATNVIRAVDVTGREVRRIVLPWTAMRLTSAMIARARREDLERLRSKEAKQMSERMYASGELPTTAPVYNTFFVGKDGSVWAEGFTLGRRGPATYLVYGEDGKPLGNVQAPAGLRLKDAGPDWVLGIHFDSDEVETIHLHSLLRH